MTTTSRKTLGEGKRALAAFFGPLPLTLFSSVIIARYLVPLGFDARLSLGAYAVIPIWATLSCTLFAAKDGRRASLVVALLTLLAGIASFVRL